MLHGLAGPPRPAPVASYLVSQIVRAEFYVISLPTSLLSSSVKANTYLLGISQVSSLDSGEAVRWVSKALSMDLGTNLLDMVGFE